MQRKYRYSKRAGALQDQSNNVELPTEFPQSMMSQSSMAGIDTHTGRLMVPAPPVEAGVVRGPGVAPLTNFQGLWFYTLREGRRALVTDRSGQSKVVEGPRRMWRWGKRFQPLERVTAHPGEFLVVRFRDGQQEHLTGPAECWIDPRTHLGVELEEALPIAANEAVVVYADADGEVTRRVEHGPATFVPAPGEWLHEFRWHGAHPNGIEKIPGALVFQKLWMMPDQMYHDVSQVRTSDDAVLTIRLMMFFELVDVERMLQTTHDPIGDFVNAATSDVVDFVGRHSFDTFKTNTHLLNLLETYVQLTSRAEQCGYRINKVVYRGYGAPPALQALHDEATQARVRLQLDRATEEQAQSLEDFTLERTLARTEKQRATRLAEQQAARLAAEADAAQRLAAQEHLDAAKRTHLSGLRDLGVDLTALLTTQPADRVIELRGQPAHLHLDG